MTADELNAAADAWGLGAIEEAVRFAYATHRVGIAPNIAAMFELAEHLRLAAFCVAQGTEAGTAETKGLGPKDDGPVLKEDAPQ